MVISASLQACGVVFPFAMPTSICRSTVTICSGLYLLIGMTRFSSKWILSHSTWYKFCRSRHNLLTYLCAWKTKLEPRFQFDFLLGPAFGLELTQGRNQHCVCG